MVGISLGFLLTDVGGGSCAVMTVGNIQIGDAGEFLGNSIDGLLVLDHPQCVADAILAHEIILGRSLSGAVNDVLEDAVIGECQEYRLNVRIIDLYVMHAVGFFLATGQLVLLDAASQVVINAGAHHKAVLRAAIHRLGIDVVAVFSVLH